MSLGHLPSFFRERGDLVSRAVLAVTQAAAIAWFSPGRGLPLDDAWIHQVVARTFAETGTLGYAPGQHGAAATSYLWAALLAIDFKLLHLDPSLWALLLNGAAALATGQLLYSVLGRAKPLDVDPDEWRATAFVASLLACLSPNVLWFTSSGMEAMPFVALSLGAIAFATSERPGRARAIAAGLCAGALALLRPEAVPLGGLLAAYVLYRRRTQSFLPIAIPWALSVALYVVTNLVKTGHALPSTLSGRRWLWFEMSAGLSRFDLALDFLDAWATRLGSYTLDASLAVTWAFVAVAVFGAVRLVRATAGQATDGAKLLLAWTLFHAAFYLLLLPSPGHGGRYQPLTPLLFAACLPFGAIFVVRDVVHAFGARHVRFAWFALAGILPWIPLAFPVARSLREANALAVAHIHATEMAAGAFLADLPGEVASFDIGGPGYASRRRVLDLGGLSDPSTAALLKEGHISKWLEEKKVRWVVLPQSFEPVLPVFEDYRARLHLKGNPAIELTPVRVFETPFDKWVPSIRATWNAAPKQVVFEVRYTGEPGPLELPAPPADALRPVSDPSALVPRRDRIVAERMLAVLEASGLAVDVHVTSAPTAPEAPSGACTISMGWWGFDAKGCTNVGDPALLRALAYEYAGRYLDVGDLGGALRAIPHVVVEVKRRSEPRYHPPIAPLMPPMPGGSALPPMSAARLGLVLFAGVLVVAFGIQAAARRESKAARLLSAVRARFAVPTLFVAALASATVPGSLGCGPSDADVSAAIARGPGAVVMAIERGGSVERGAPLLEAAAAGNADVVALLVSRGARLDVLAPDGATPLHLAARHGHHGAATVLASALTRAARCDGCAPDESALAAAIDTPAGPRGRTALHEAVLAGSVETASTLLAAGANANAVDTFGQTPLHLLATGDPARSSAVALALLAGRADPTIVDARGFTALHAAAAAGNVPLVRVLASRLMLVDQKTAWGETALEVALRYQRDLAADALLRAGASLPGEGALPPLHQAARVDSVERAASLLASGADPLWRFDGKTALDVAVTHKSTRVEALLRERAR